MEHLPGGYTLCLSENAFPLSTDSMLLASFAKLSRKASVLDLGSGCGTLGLLLCASDSLCAVTGIELDPQAHAGALENISSNQLQNRMHSLCGDIRNIGTLVKPGSFHCCISNPPYFSGGPASKAHATARRNDCCTTEELFHAAAWAVKYGGDFFLVHRPEQLASIFACARNNQLEPKRLCLVRHKPQDPVSLVLVHCRKGAKPGLLWEELHLFEPDGSPSDEYKKIYHL